MIDIDLHLHRGSFALDAKLRINQPVVGLFGPSGSGKSTLLGTLAGLIKPDGGRFAVDGDCLFDAAQGIDLPAHQRRIGLVFQDSRLFPHLSVRSNLVYGLDLLRKQQRRLDLANIVELLEIGHMLKQHPHQLSGGERQRVALGRALLASPRLLLLDEPLAALDTRLKNQILPFLRRVKEHTQIPMIYVSHAINEVLHLTQTMAIIEGGSILAHGDFHEVIKDDRVLSLAHSLGMDNVINAAVSEHNSEFGYTLAEHNGHQLLLPYFDVPLGAAISISIPATNIALARTRQVGITIQNQLPGVITAIRQVDHRVLVSVNIGCLVIAEVTAKAVHDLGLAPGQQVYCLIKAQAMRYLGASAN